MPAVIGTTLTAIHSGECDLTTLSKNPMYVTDTGGVSGSQTRIVGTIPNLARFSRGDSVYGTPPNAGGSTTGRAVGASGAAGAAALDGSLTKTNQGTTTGGFRSGAMGRN